MGSTNTLAFTTNTPTPTSLPTSHKHPCFYLSPTPQHPPLYQHNPVHPNTPPNGSPLRSVHGNDKRWHDTQLGALSQEWRRPNHRFRLRLHAAPCSSWC